MTPTRMSVSYILEPAGRWCRPRASITWAGRRLRMALNVRVTEQYWERSLQRCRAKTFHGPSRTPAAVVNRFLDEFEEKVAAAFMEFARRDIVPEPSSLRKAIAPAREEGQGEETDFFRAYDSYIRDRLRAGMWTDSTWAKYRTLRKHLLEANPDIGLRDLANGDSGFLVAHLTSQGIANGTVRRSVALLRSFVRWATAKGLCEPGRFLAEKTRLKNVRRPVVYLTWEELMKLYRFDFGADMRLSQVRDVFCFCCFTSLRYSDVSRLRPEDVDGDAVRITTRKTAESLRIELNRYSAAIYRRYAARRWDCPTLFPPLSNQKMNDRLKEIGLLCGFVSPVAVTTYVGSERRDKVYRKWQLLSTHCARRTFISNALMLGIPADVVMKWTGHSDYRAMRPYIEISSEATLRAMARFNKD